MKLNAFKVVSLLTMSVYLAGCATIYGRQNDAHNVHFESNVENVLVLCSGDSVETPGNIALKQSSSHFCHAAKEGYESRYFRIRSGVSKDGFDYSTSINTSKWGKWTLGIGTLIGWVVDLTSGAMRTLEKDRYYLDMQFEGEKVAGSGVLNKTLELGKSLVAMPKEVVQSTATTVLDTTVRVTAEQSGAVKDTARVEAEQQVEGKKEAKRLEELEEQAPFDSRLAVG